MLFQGVRHVRRSATFSRISWGSCKATSHLWRSSRREHRADSLASRTTRARVTHSRSRRPVAACVKQKLMIIAKESGITVQALFKTFDDDDSGDITPEEFHCEFLAVTRF